MQALNVQVDARTENWHAGVSLDPDSAYVIEPSAADRYTLTNGATYNDFHGWGEMDGHEIGIPKNPIRLGGLTVLVWRHQPGGQPPIAQILDFPPGINRAYARIGTNGGSMSFVIADKAGTYADNSGICNVTVTKGDEGGPMGLLLETTGEYGWSHKGHDSWGDNWGVNACNEALEQIRGRIREMVNLRELETFSNSNLKNSLGIDGAVAKDSASLKIATSYDKSDQEQVHWVNENNFLVDVANVRIKPGTGWTDTSQDWQGRRKWEASATMQYDLRIYGRK